MLLVVVVRPADGQKIYQQIIALIHAHTNYSPDGTRTILETAQEARGRGIQAVCLSDHYQNIRDFDRYSKECEEATHATGVLMVPGVEVEIGGDNDGCYEPNSKNHIHILGLGIDRQLLEMEREIGLRRDADIRRLGKPEKTVKLWDGIDIVLAAIRDAGGVPVFAHPWQTDFFRLGHYTAYTDHIKGIVGIEFFNDSDPGAVLKELYLPNLKSAQLFVTAGSDTHGFLDKFRDDRFKYLTFLSVKQNVGQPTAVEVLDALRNGRTYATCGDLRLGADSAIPGYDQNQPDKQLKVVSPVQVTFNVRSVETQQGEAKVAYFADKFFVTSPIFTEAAIRPEPDVIRPEPAGGGKLYLLAGDLYAISPDGAGLQKYLQTNGLCGALDITTDGRYALAFRSLGRDSLVVIDLPQKRIVVEWEDYAAGFQHWIGKTYKILANHRPDKTVLLGSIDSAVAVDPFTRQKDLIWTDPQQGLLRSTRPLTVAPNGQDLVLVRVRDVFLHIGGREIPLPLAIGFSDTWQWSPDGRLIATVNRGQTRSVLTVIDLNGRTVWTAEISPANDPAEVRDLAWSPDSQQIALCCADGFFAVSPSVVTIFSAQGRLLKSFRLPDIGITGIAWAP